MSIFDDLLSKAKTVLSNEAAKKKAELLQQGGRLIASTPEGQQGIKDELAARGQRIVVAALPYGTLLAGGILLYFLFSPRRSRRR